MPMAKGWLGVVLLGVGLVQPANAATVLRVVDGDTVVLGAGAKQERVRLACVDAPESTQPLGAAATAALRLLLPVGTSVTLKAQGKDRYGRVVAEVLRGRTNVNLALVEGGDAFVYWRFIGGCDRTDYQQAEQRAKRQRLGVWSAGSIQRPWEYRLAE